MLCFRGDLKEWCRVALKAWRLLQCAALALVVAVFAVQTVADEADVVEVVATPGTGGWRFDVTVRHGDEGWEHYADQWDVVSPDGAVLGTRVLLHPHVGEQPFTRSLTGVAIPDGVDRVVLRARDSVHGYGGVEVEVELNQ